ncbi:MAG TPA: hypothetical protein V6D19_20015 [Stenomitos sp.]
MDEMQDVFGSPTLSRLLLFTYLVPVFGMVPAAWCLMRSQGNRQQQHLSRLSLTIGGTWLLGSLLFNASLGALDENAISAQIWMLLFNGTFSAGYFVTCLWLMLRLGKRQKFDPQNLRTIAKYL